MVKQPFSVKGIMYNKHMLLQLQHVVQIATEAARAAEMPDPNWNPLIIEDFGHTLDQGSYIDKHGVYVTYRLHPLDAHLEKTKQVAAHFEKKLGYVFNHRPMQKPTFEDKDGVRTVYLYGDIISTGD
jgi:hypothetical protein